MSKEVESLSRAVLMALREGNTDEAERLSALLSQARSDEKHRPSTITNDVMGVRKCPRCEAVGVVRANPMDRRGYAMIDWARNGKTWRDTGVSSGDLAGPDFGCGHCGTDDRDILNMDEVNAASHASDIVAVVGETVHLEKNGRSWIGTCPACNGARALHVLPSSQIAQCLGCHKALDAFGWVMRRDGVSFAEALKTLQEAAKRRSN